MAQIGWIDFSKTHKDKITAVLAMLKPEGRVDELGIGIIRDALADHLFPGISTIQTRAKYFYIVPSILWNYFQLPAYQKKKKPLSRFLEEKERAIMYRLAEAYNHEEGHGVIGITKRKGDILARNPSVIYWNGLNTFGFIQYSRYSLGAYLNRFAKYEAEDEIHFIPSGDDDPADDADNNYNNYMGIRAPYNEKYEELETLELTSEEAEDFSRRIINHTPQSLLAELLRNEKLSKLFFKINYSGREGFVAFATQALDLIDNMKLSRTIALAHDFSLAMYGAHITYNQAIQRALDQEDDFEDFWQDWLIRIKSGFIQLDSLNPGALYEVAPRMKPYTRKFLAEWIQLIKEQDFYSSKRFSLVEGQEYCNKNHKARLRNKKLDGRDKGRWLGFDFLDYRFGNAKTILNDIQTAR